MSQEVVKVLRLIQYEGPQEWIDHCLSRSLLEGKPGAYVAGEGKVVRNIITVIRPNDADIELLAYMDAVTGKTEGRT